MKRAFCFTIALCLLLTLTGCTSKKQTDDINQYGKFLAKAPSADLHMPKVNELGTYSDIQLTHMRNIIAVFQTDTVGLFLSYDADNYKRQKEYILENYVFYLPDDAGLESDCDASVDGYDVKLVETSYDLPTYKMGLLIGMNDSNYQICYLYYYDFDLDILDDLDGYITSFFDIP